MTVLRSPSRVTARNACGAGTRGNSEQSSAIVPVTNGAAALVPPKLRGLLSLPKAATSTPGARRPRLPIEAPRLEDSVGSPFAPQAATGITQGCRVIAELPIAR